MIHRAYCDASGCLFRFSINDRFEDPIDLRERFGIPGDLFGGQVFNMTIVFGAQPPFQN